MYWTLSVFEPASPLTWSKLSITVLPLIRALRKVYKTRIGYKSSGFDQLLKLNKDKVVIGKVIVASFKSS